MPTYVTKAELADAKQKIDARITALVERLTTEEGERAAADLELARAIEGAPEPPPDPPDPPAESSRLWGLWDDPGQGNMIWLPSEWDAVESQFGQLELVHYGQGLTPDAGTMRLAASRGGIPFLDWGSNVSVADVNAGRYDANFRSIDAAMQGFGSRIIFRPLWEMNLQVPPWGRTRPDPGAYRSAWQRIHGLLTASNCEFHWCPNWFVPAWGGAPDPTPYYPGDEYVDYTGADIYVEDWPVRAVSDPILGVLEALGKPAIIGEWGVSRSKANQPQAVAEFLELLPDWVVGQCYFNWDTGGAGDWRLSAAGVAAFNQSR